MLNSSCCVIVSITNRCLLFDLMRENTSDDVGILKRIVSIILAPLLFLGC